VTAESPYKGLDAFGESDLDALLFFGREREREIVQANLIASRLTVLYGPTGVGKSSLLHAAVARSLRGLPESPLVVVFDHWSDDPVASLRAAVRDATGDRSTDGLFEAVSEAQRSRDVYLILDQAEEYFVYNGDGVGFDSDLARLVAEPVRVNVLLSLREDSLARLDQFKPQIPSVYANSLRLDRLDRNAARAAIIGPIGRWNELMAERVEIETPLVESVLDGVAAGRIEQHGGGLGGAEVNGRAPAVEAPYLQLVMQRVWEVERAAGSTRLRAETLEKLGGARRVVADHLEGAVDALTPHQQDLAALLFTYLVTPSGTKIAHDLPDLAEYAGVTQAEAAPVVETLSRHRILRPDEAGRTEIFHDVLAGEVLAWRRRHAADRGIAFERERARARHRRLLAIIVAGAILLALMAGVTAYALTQRDEAQQQARRATAAAAVAAEQTRIANAQKAEAERQKEVADAARVKAVRAEQEADEQAEAAVEAQEQAEANAQLADQNAAEAEAAEQQANESAAEAAESEEQAETAAKEAVEQKNAAERARAAATEAANEAQARARAARSLALLTTRPLAALGLALTAARSEATELRLAESVLRTSLAATRVRGILPGGGGPVRDASFSPDGRMVLTVARRARLFDASTGAPIRTLADPSDVRAAQFNQYGTVVTAGGDGIARLWSLGQSRSRSFGGGGAPKLLRGHTKAIVDARFSSSGDLVVTASNDRTARVWSTKSGRELSVLQHEFPVLSAVLSPDGKLVVTVSGRPTTTGPLLARLFDASTGVSLVTFNQRGIRSAGFTPDGSSVVTTSNDDSTRIWSLTGVQQARLEQDEDVVSAAFSPDARRLVTATEGGGAYVWQLVDGTWSRAFVLVGPLNLLTGASFSPDGRFIALSSLDRKIWIYRAQNGLLVAVLAGHGDGVTRASFGPDGRSLLSASNDGSARIWDPGTEDLLELVGEHNGKLINRAVFSPDGRLAVSASADGTARILDVPRHRQLHVLRHDAGVNDAEFNSVGTLVVTASDDSSAAIWRTSGDLLRVLPHPDAVLRAIFSPDGVRVATACVDGAVRVWRTSDGTLLHTLGGHQGLVLDVSFSPGGQFVASAGADATARVWRADGEQIHVLHHRGPVARVSFSPRDGRLVLTASGDEMARLWDASTGRLVHLLRGHEDAVSDARFSPDGTRVVTASEDRDARIWSVATGRSIKLLRGHLRGPQTAVFSPDGRWVLTTGRIAAGLWDANSGEFFAPTGLNRDPFLRGHSSGLLTSAVFSPDGRRILTAAGDGTVRTYACDLCGGTRDLIRLAVLRLEALAAHLTASERALYLRG
jgi:WD40 repeat protein